MNKEGIALPLHQDIRYSKELFQDGVMSEEDFLARQDIFADRAAELEKELAVLNKALDDAALDSQSDYEPIGAAHTGAEQRSGLTGTCPTEARGVGFGQSTYSERRRR